MLRLPNKGFLLWLAGEGFPSLDSPAASDCLTVASGDLTFTEWIMLCKIRWLTQPLLPSGGEVAGEGSVLCGLLITMNRGPNFSWTAQNVSWSDVIFGEKNLRFRYGGKWYYVNLSCKRIFGNMEHSCHHHPSPSDRPPIRGHPCLSPHASLQCVLYRNPFVNCFSSNWFAVYLVLSRGVWWYHASSERYSRFFLFPFHRFSWSTNVRLSSHSILWWFPCPPIVDNPFV